MCGIVGLLGSFALQREAMFEDMMKMATLRGFDSSGAAFIRPASEEQVYIKAAWMPHYLIEDKEWRHEIAKNNTGLIGHCRLATKGKVTDDNAHPFQHGDITLVHNGGVTGMNNSSKFETDSEGICSSVNAIGIDETWKQMYGAAALAWWDNKDKTLNLLRNADRPMWFANIKDGGIAFASEPWMIHAAAGRRKIDIVGMCKLLEPHYLWTFKVDGIDIKDSYRKLEERKIVIHSKIGEHSKLPLGPGKKSNTKRGGKEFSMRTLDPNLPEIEDRFTGNVAQLKINHLAQRAIEFPKGREQASKELLTRFQEDSKKMQGTSIMTASQFNEVFKECISCRESLLGQQDTAIQIDSRKACCSKCAEDAANMNISLHAF